MLGLAGRFGACLLLAVALAALSPPAPPPASATGVSALALGRFHTCAVTGLGAVRCWGLNDFGQLGDGTTIDRTLPTPVPGLTEPATALAAGFSHSCVVNGSGGVTCWGSNSYGQLGNGTTATSHRPVDVAGLAGATRVVAGGLHTCALTGSGGVKCWGRNNGGQLGDGTFTDRLTPVDVAGLTGGVVALAAGSNHTCAITSTDALKCWGLNDFGQLGDGTTTNGTMPVDVTGLSGVVTVSGGAAHTCAVTTAGAAKCWGLNFNGQLGTGAATVDPPYGSTAPLDVVGLGSGVSAVSAGGLFTCALAAGGTKCWGRNNYGQLGNGVPGDTASPVDVVGSGDDAVVVAGSPGGFHACSLTTGGGVRCWGRNNRGQLGNGTTGEINFEVFIVRGFESDIDGDGLPNDTDPDDDGDGCTDAQELGPDGPLGGGRNPKDYWDFFDTPDASNARDRAIAISDIVRVVARFGTSGDPTGNPRSAPPATGYHTAFDRRPAGNDLTGPADGVVAIGDVVLAVVQFGHTCAGGP